MKSKILWKVAAAAVSTTLLALSMPATAAFISVDDSDPLNITITAGDFEGGFFVNGNLLTTGVGNSASITLVDGGYTISGSWIDLGAADDTRVDLLFALAGNPGFSTSGIEFGAVSDGFNATLTGSFGGYIDPSLYFPTALPTLLQNGQTGIAGVPFLSVEFTSEVPTGVPTPGTLALVGLGGALLAFRRRARR